MKKALLFFVICLACTMPLRGQTNYTHEIGLISDNDCYYFMGNDQYYTNGLMLYLRYVPRSHNKKSIKEIIEVRAGQKIYTPYQAYITWDGSIDRPFAGYLFLEGGISKFYANESMVKTALQVGVLGPSAGAEEVQSVVHDLCNLYEPEGWQYQVNDAAGVNLQVYYLKSLDYFFNRHLDLNLASELRFGTIHSDISFGFLARSSIYKLRPIYSSAITGSSIGRDTEASPDNELLLYVRPRVKYVFYDATIQGGVYSGTNPVTFDVRPLQFHLEAGISGTYNHFVAGYSLVFHTREVLSDRVKNHLYASIHIAYRY